MCKIIIFIFILKLFVFDTKTIIFGEMRKGKWGLYYSAIIGNIGSIFF